LRKPVPREQQYSALPGYSVGTIGATSPYPLPLTIELKSISPQPLRLGEKFNVEVLLTNTGTSVFLLPGSSNGAVVLKQGNKERRSFSFSLLFQNPKTGKEAPSVEAVVAASASKPKSWLRIGPGETIQVLFTGHLDAIGDWVREGLKQLDVRAGVFEWTYDDNRYFIKDRSQQVLSDHALTLDITPPN
jgi:hypothetical protein